MRESIARNRFMAAHTQEEALRRMDLQSLLCLDAIGTVNSFPWIFTNAGTLAESCAHWAFIAHPELRVDDDFWSN